MSLDAADADLSGSGPFIVDVPGATPSALVVAIGKDRNAYLLNRSNLGGVSVPLAQAVVSTGTVIGAPATYRTIGGHVCRSSPHQRHAPRFPHYGHQSADHRHRLERCRERAHRTLRDFHRWH